MLFIIIFNWTCFWLLVKWVFLIKWFMQKVQNKVWALCSSQWIETDVFLNGLLFSHIPSIFIGAWYVHCWKVLVIQGLSLSLSVILIFSVFLSLYISPFPKVSSNTNNICQYCAPPPPNRVSLWGTIRYRYSFISCLFIFHENRCFGTVAVWLMSSLWTEWDHNWPLYAALCAFSSKTFIERSRKVLSMFCPPDGWTQSQAIQTHFSTDPQYQHFQYCVHKTHRSLDRQFKSKDDAGLVPVENKQHTLFSVFSQDQSQCSLDSSAMQKMLLNHFFPVTASKDP